MLEKVVAIAGVLYFAFLAYVATSAEWLAFDLVRLQPPERPPPGYLARVYEITLENAYEVKGFLDGAPAEAKKIGFVPDTNSRRLRSDVKKAMGMTVVVAGSAYELVAPPRFFEDQDQDQDQGERSSEDKTIFLYALQGPPRALPWADPESNAGWHAHVNRQTPMRIMGVPRV